MKICFQADADFNEVIVRAVLRPEPAAGLEGVGSAAGGPTRIPAEGE
jgi:hypothetical protein